MDEQFIKSFVRIKPSTPNQASIIGVQRNSVYIGKQYYPFNEVFDESTQNEYIYEKTIMPMMSDFFNGYNACILAYGQTSSGKTYTMKGVNQNLGLIPLCIKQIFKRIQTLNLYAKVNISYFQIYNQNIIDLLSQEQIRYLDLRQDGKKNLVIVDLINHEVKDQLQTLSLYQKGELKRKFASNNINISSSRSHTIFKIILSSVNQQNILLESSIYMVDLAGSESISKTNAVGVLKKQAQNINKSLLHLTKTIRDISKKQGYINYRNSKLTRILQNCLCGLSKTLVICTIKSSQQCLSQTINTLKFGISANSIKTQARQNITSGSMQIDNTQNDSILKMLQQQKRQRGLIQLQLQQTLQLLQTQKLINANLISQIQNCKHQLFALQNQNSHHNGLIQFYKKQQQLSKTNKNIFYQKSQQSIALIQKQNKNLKINIINLNQSLDKKNKKIILLQKNQRILLDKIQKYQNQLNKLQSILVDGQKKYIRKSHRFEDNKKNQGRKNIQNINQINEKQQKMSFHQIARYSPPKNGKLSNPFTIGTVVSLSTTILSLKIDMNHYLKTITDLHTENSELQAKIDEITTKRETQNNRQSGIRRQSGLRSKQDDKKIRKIQLKLVQIKKQNQKLKKKNAHYLKILKKCANNNIQTIQGFNQYLRKNFKENQKALFEQLMQENSEDYEPFSSYEYSKRVYLEQQQKILY